VDDSDRHGPAPSRLWMMTLLTDEARVRTTRWEEKGVIGDK